MSRLKLYAHTCLPKRAVSCLQAVRRYSYKGDPSIQLAQSRFAQLNRPKQASRIIMREGIELAVHEESFESFQWFCWRSLAMVGEYDLFLSDCHTKSTFLDVGACHGVYSLTFLTVNCRGHAIVVEPSLAAREILEHNINANCLGDRVVVCAYAAGDDDGKMYAMPNWHHLEAIRSNNSAVVVDTKSVDAICDEYASMPDLVKVDVEGFELYVLKGATLVLSRRPVVYLEIHPQLTAKLGYDHTKCFDLMAEIGYEISEVDGHPMTRKEFSQRHHTFFTVCR